MPSIRKRIGYLPSINTQETITKIANKENISQSKVVGILVEEALIARTRLELQKSNHLIRKNLYNNVSNIDNSYFKNNDLDELISDKGITYNTKKNKNDSDDDLYEERKEFNEDLFEQFKQFIIFQKIIQNK